MAKKPTPKPSKLQVKKPRVFKKHDTPYTAVIVPASKVPRKPMRYLWDQKIPIGCTTTYFGMPECGKSSQALDVAARVSRGLTWPNSEIKATKGSTLIIAHEDGAEQVITSRYEAMGGDMNKLKIFKGVHKNTAIGKKKLNWLDFSKHLPAIENAISEIRDLKLAIIDPISAYLGDADTSKITVVRSLLGPLNEVAQRHDLAILLIHHVNKNNEQAVIHRMSGSTAFGDLTRQAWVFAKDKVVNGRKLMVPAKKSYGPPTTGLAFRIVQTSSRDENSIKLEYEPEPLKKNAESLFTDHRELGRPSNKREEAEAFLRDTLADGPVPRSKVRELSEMEGITERTLRRTVVDMKIKKVRPKRGDYSGLYCWKLS